MVVTNDAKRSPIFRWAGGKSWLIPYIKSLLQIEANNYIEPFLGGGSVFMYVKEFGNIAGRFYLSDFNNELINTYKIISVQNRK